MERYCDFCRCEQKVQIITKNETFLIQGQPIATTSDVLTCVVCGEEMFDPELDEINLQRAFKNRKLSVRRKEK